MADDIVEEVIESLRLQSSIFCRMELTGDWGFSKPALQGAPFYIVLAGELWVRLPTQADPVRGTVGDLLILPSGDGHEILASADAPTVPFKPVLAELGWAAWSPGMRYKTGVLRHQVGNGPTTVLIAGVFGFDDRRENPLLTALPKLFHLRREDFAGGSDSWFEATTRFLCAEVDSGQPGSGSVAARLADIIFIQAVRMHLRSGREKDRGWLRGIADPQIGRSLSLMHSHPERPWSVASLAKAVSMSRARYAARFQELVGRGPLDYLTRWRMYEAAGHLSRGKGNLPELAARAGYTSDIAFSKAFKRWSGHSPTDFKRWMISNDGSGAREELAKQLQSRVDTPFEV